jgi:hypothetical protein
MIKSPLDILYAAYMVFSVAGIAGAVVLLCIGVYFGIIALLT